MKNIYVIGGSGFLGSSLLKDIQSSGMNAYSCDIKKTDLSKYIYVDVTEPKSLEKISKADAIINLAAVHRDDVRPISKYDDVNVFGAENICKFAAKRKINTIVFTSSVAVYGFAPKNTNESGDKNYFNDYGRTKFLAENIFKKWQQENPKERCLIIIRPTVIFGKGNRGNVYNLLKTIASKKFVMFGKGENKKSMAYVENVSSFIINTLNFDPGVHIYNYADKPDLTMSELVIFCKKIIFGKTNLGLKLPKFIGVIAGYIFDFLSSITRKKLNVSSIRVKKFLSDSSFDATKKDQIFKPPFTLLDGLKKTIIYEFKEDNKDKKIFYTE